MTRISLTVDGESCHDDVEPSRLLVDWLVSRGRPGPDGLCDDARCGSCTVQLDGRSVKACNLLAVQADRTEVTTLAGLADDGGTHPVQAAIADTGADPCPGVVVQAAYLLAEHPSPSEDQVRAGLVGHRCACVDEEGLVRAVLTAARQPGFASAEGAS